MKVTNQSISSIRGAIVILLLALFAFSMAPSIAVGDGGGAVPPWGATSPPPDSTKGDSDGSNMPASGAPETVESEIGLLEVVETLLIVL